jgi:hypothetical protein
MAKRSYLDLTPAELRARRIALLGLALLVMPPLLTLCHLHQFLCQATWNGTFTSLIALAPLFPWTSGVALLMLAGLGLCLVGGALFLLAAPPASSAAGPSRIIAVIAR